MLDIYFDAERTPEAQQSELRKIPPSSTIDHPAIKAALTRYEAARGDELAKRHEYAEAEGPALARARMADQEALADALAAGKPDPGPKHEQKAEEALAGARRRHGAAKIALARAVAEIVAAFGEHGPAYGQDLEHERDALRDQMAKTLAEWLELYGQLQRNAAARALVNGVGVARDPSVFLGVVKAPRLVDGDGLPVTEVVDVLRDVGKPRTASLGAVEKVPLGADPVTRR